MKIFMEEIITEIMVKKKSFGFGELAVKVGVAPSYLNDIEKN